MSDMVENLEDWFSRIMAPFVELSFIVLSFSPTDSEEERF